MNPPPPFLAEKVTARTRSFPDFIAVTSPQHHLTSRRRPLCSWDFFQGPYGAPRPRPARRPPAAITHTGAHSMEWALGWLHARGRKQRALLQEHTPHTAGAKDTTMPLTHRSRSAPKQAGGGGGQGKQLQPEDVKAVPLQPWVWWGGTLPPSHNCRRARVSVCPARNR